MQRTTVILQPLLHLGKLYWKLAFKQNPMLHKKLQQVPGVKYSHTYGCLVCYAHQQQFEVLQQAMPELIIKEAASLLDNPCRLSVFPLADQQVLLRHAYDKTLFHQLKQLAYLHFSPKHKGWIADLKKIKLDRLILELKTIAPVFLDARLQLNSIEELTAAWQPYTPALSEEKVVCVPKEYLEALFVRNYSKATIKTYQSLLLRFMQELKLRDGSKLKEVKEEQVNRYHAQWIASGKVAASTVNQSVNAIRFYFKHVVRAPLALEDVHRPQKSRQLPKVMSKEEVVSLLKNTENVKHRAMLGLIYSAGLRCGELLNLRLVDVQLERRQLIIGKGKGAKDRITVLSPRAILLLQSYLQKYSPREYLFEGQYGGAYTDSSLRMVLRKALAKAGISRHYTLHCLRHSRFGGPICYPSFRTRNRSSLHSNPVRP